MLTGQDRTLDRLATARDAAQARALADGGITSVAVALRRDSVMAPQSDHLSEPWALAAQETVTLEFGEFATRIDDLRGRFDLNALGPAKLAEARVSLLLVVAYCNT